LSDFSSDTILLEVGFSDKDGLPVYCTAGSGWFCKSMLPSYDSFGIIAGAHERDFVPKCGI